MSFLSGFVKRSKKWLLSRCTSTVLALLAVDTPAHAPSSFICSAITQVFTLLLFFNTFRVIVIAASFNQDVLSTHLLIVLLLSSQTRRKLSLLDQTRGEIFTGRLGCSIFSFTKRSFASKTNIMNGSLITAADNITQTSGLQWDYIMMY